MNSTSVLLLVLPSGGIHNIQQHTFGLARYTYMLLSSLCHGNGQPAAQIYAEGQFESPSTQGAILNFNLMDSNGHIIGYSQVSLIKMHFLLLHNYLMCLCAKAGLGEIFKIVLCSQVDRMASLYNIHVRTGCFCNTGACQSFLGITSEQMRKNLHVRVW